MQLTGVTSLFKRSVAFFVVSFAVMTLGAGRLRADDLSFTLSFTNGFTTCPAGGCATVNVNVSGGKAAITVTSLLNGYQFDEFGLNLPSGDSVSLLSASGAGLGSSYGLTGGGQLDGFGKFDYVFDTGINGGSTGGNCVVAGGSASAGCSFTFTLTGTGLTNASVFEVLSTNGNGQGDAWFAGHIAGSACTGFTGGGNTTGLHNGSTGCTPVSAPEPNSLTLLSSALLALFLGGTFFGRRSLAAA